MPSARDIKRNRSKITRCLRTKCGDALLNAAARGVKGRGVANQIRHHEDAVRHVDIVRRLGRLGQVASMPWTLGG